MMKQKTITTLISTPLCAFAQGRLKNNSNYISKLSIILLSGRIWMKHKSVILLPPILQPTPMRSHQTIVFLNVCNNIVANQKPTDQPVADGDHMESNFTIKICIWRPTTISMFKFTFFPSQRWIGELCIPVTWCRRRRYFMYCIDVYIISIKIVSKYVYLYSEVIWVL